MDLEPRRKILGKGIYIGLLSSHIQLRKFSVLKIMVSQGKLLCDISYVLSLLLPTHLFIATEMNIGLDGPLVQTSRVLLMGKYLQTASNSTHTANIQSTDSQSWKQKGN